MRWTYLLPRFVLLSLVWGVLTIAVDPLVHQGLVVSGQLLSGAKVDVGDALTSLFPPGLVVDKVRIANRFQPGTNLIEFDRIDVRLAAEPLLKQSYIVNEGSITGLRWGTPREDAGTLDVPWIDINLESELLGSLRNRLTNSGEDLLGEAFRQLQLQLDPQQLESVRLAEALRATWTERFTTLQQRVEHLEIRVNDLDKKVADARELGLKRLTAYRRLLDEVDELLAETARIRRDVTVLPQTANRDLRNLDEARLRDQQTIQRKIKLFRLDGEAISELLLGPELKDRLERATVWCEWARKSIDRLSYRPEPLRHAGYDILFPRAEKLPKFLIERLDVSGEARLGNEMIPFSGTVAGITTEPAVYGKPLVIELAGQAAAQFRLHAILDQTKPKPTQEFAITYTLPEKTETTLGNDQQMAFLVSSEQTQLSAEFQLSGDSVSGELAIRQEPVVVEFLTAGDTAPETTEFVTAALNSFRQLEASVVWSGTLDEPRWKLRSNLGPQLAVGLNHVLTQRIESKRRELSIEADAMAQEQMAAFKDLIRNRSGTLMTQLNSNELVARHLFDRLASGGSLGLDRILRR